LQTVAKQGGEHWLALNERHLHACGSEQHRILAQPSRRIHYTWCLVQPTHASRTHEQLTVQVARTKTRQAARKVAPKLKAKVYKYKSSGIK
jgi:hypothetical protein